jgi:hypothetical protein
MLLTRGQPWRAREFATRAVAGYRELGMDRHAARAQSLQGAPGSAPHARARRMTNAIVPNRVTDDW